MTPVNPAANSMAHIIDFQFATGALAAPIASKACLEANGVPRTILDLSGHNHRPSRAPYRSPLTLESRHRGDKWSDNFNGTRCGAASVHTTEKIAFADVDTTLKHVYNYASASL